ncbi:MAG: hypothetical protein WCC87_23180 [Candidatus Korobacteraceae bacterium]
MAEFLRRERDEELTTADLAGRSEKAHERDVRPQLVRGQRVTEPESALDSSARTPIPLPEEGTSAARDSVVGAANLPAALFSDSEVGDFRSRWSSIQTGFVDEPRRAVEDADNLVASLMKKLAESFANERAGLEKQWDRGDNVSTEDLRVALQRYRSFFDRLLKV